MSIGQHFKPAAGSRQPAAGIGSPASGTGSRSRGQGGPASGNGGWTSPSGRRSGKRTDGVEMKRVLCQTGSQEAGRRVAPATQDGAMREPDRAGGAAEEGAMRWTNQGAQQGGLARPQLQYEVGLVADVRELVGDERAAQRPEPLAAGQGLERAVVDVAYQLGRDEDVQVELESAKPPDAAEQGVAPVPGSCSNAVLVHELAQQPGMALLLANEELRDPWQELLALGSRETACRAKQAAAIGLLAELERRDGAGNEAALLGPQRRHRPGRCAARLLRVVFEMVQPDPEIAEHDNVRRRAWRESRGEPGGCSGAIVANSGSGKVSRGASLA